MGADAEDRYPLQVTKLARRELYAGRAVAVPWKAHRPPRNGAHYALQNDRGVTIGRVQVVALELPLVRVTLVTDPVRLLARTGGYTSNDGQALADGYEVEPEAVSEEAQAEITAAAHRAGAVDATALLDHFDTITKALDAIGAHPAAKHVRRELWQLRGRTNAAKERLERRAVAV